MTAANSEILSLAAQFLQYIASLPPDDAGVTASDVKGSYAGTLQALAYLHDEGYVAGRPNLSNGNTEGLVAIENVRILPRGRNWLADLNRTGQRAP